MFLIICICVCLYRCLCIWMQVTLEARCRIPWIWSYTQLWACCPGTCYVKHAGQELKRDSPACFLSAGIKDMGSKDQRVNENHLTALHLGHSHMQVTFPPAEICGWNEDPGYWQFGAITLSPVLAPVVFLATASMLSVWREMKLYQVTNKIQKVTHVLGVVVHTFIPQHRGSRGRRIWVQSQSALLSEP